MLKRSPDFDSRFRNEDPHTSARKAARVEWTHSTQRSEIEGVIDVERRSRLEPASHHGSGAGVRRPNANRQDQRIGLQISDPNGVKPLVKYSKGSKESANRHGQVRIGNEIQLEIVDLLPNL